METTLLDIEKLSIEKDNSSLSLAFVDIPKKFESISKPLMNSILRYDFITATEPQHGFNKAKEVNT